MKKYVGIIVALVLLMVPIAWSQSLQSALYNDIEDMYLEDFSHIEAALILSGADTPDSLNAASDWFGDIVEDIRQKRIVDVFQKEASAEKLFLYLHSTWLKKYVKEATTLLDIKNRNEFNCVSATILYNLCCDELDLRTMAFETPTHVYTIFINFNRVVMVENTSPMGFNIIKNLNNYSRYMRQYYPENRMYQIGMDRLYAYENSKGRRITNTELLGLISYNQAYLAFEEKGYDDAYEYVLLAQQFNQDSRSNKKFEINLYYTQGRELFRQKSYDRAFGLFADAAYRYPDNRDFSKNCLAAFMNSLKTKWAHKDWSDVTRIIYEMLDLDILTQKEINFTKNYVLDWADHFTRTQKKSKAMEAISLLKNLNGYNTRARELEKAIEMMQ